MNLNQRVWREMDLRLGVWQPDRQAIWQEAVELAREGCSVADSVTLALIRRYIRCVLLSPEHTRRVL